MDPLKVRAEVLADHLSYQARMRKGFSLAHSFPEFREEVCEALVAMGDQSDFSLSDKAELLGILARLNWKSDLMKRELLELAKASHPYGMLSDRAKACNQLAALRERDLAIEGHMSILMDSEISLSGRSLQARHMARTFPEQKNVALRVMWAASRDQSIDALRRISILRDICDLDPKCIDKATRLIAEIKNGSISNVQRKR